MLSRNTEFGGTLTSGMIPWSDNGIFMSTLLGVSTVAYLPYMWLNFAVLQSLFFLLRQAGLPIMLRQKERVIKIRFYIFIVLIEGALFVVCNSGSNFVNHRVVDPRSDAFYFGNEHRFLPPNVAMHWKIL